MADIQATAVEIRREKKESNKLQHENIMVCPIGVGLYRLNQPNTLPVKRMKGSQSTNKNTNINKGKTSADCILSGWTK